MIVDQEMDLILVLDDQKKDGDKNEWILVPKGLCNKLVGGSTVPGK